jgi:hypothetical protein
MKPPNSVQQLSLIVIPIGTIPPHCILLIESRENSLNYLPR